MGTYHIGLSAYRAHSEPLLLTVPCFALALSGFLWKDNWENLQLSCIYGVMTLFNAAMVLGVQQEKLPHLLLLFDPLLLPVLWRILKTFSRFRRVTQQSRFFS